MKPFHRSNFLIVLSAPSGGGKTTICREMLMNLSELDYSVSYTTRSPRKDEVNGKSYFFVTKEEFEEMIAAKEFLEHAEVHENYYGTSKNFIFERFAQNRDVIMDIDVQGASNIMKSGIECVTIFLLPPDIATLTERLKKRDSDSKEAIEIRLHNAVKEISEMKNYQYLVVNDELSVAIDEVKSIIIAERNKTKRFEADDLSRCCKKFMED